MDRPDSFIKGALRITISNDSGSVDVLVPYDPTHLFQQIVNALMCENDVCINHSFIENHV